MRFVAWNETAPLAGALCVDGIVPDAPNLSHWPGNRTPPHLRADTTTEIVLRALADPEGRRLLEGASAITNNHFDTDGVLSVALALDRRPWADLEGLFVAAARAGDLSLHGGEQAVLLDLCVAGLAESQASPIAGALAALSGPARLQRAYDEALLRLPELVANPRAYLEIWEEELEEIREGMAAFAAGRARIAARVAAADAVLVVTQSPLHELPLWTHAGASRVLVATAQPGGRHSLELRYGMSSWFDLPVPPPRRRDLAPLQRALARLEPPGPGSWQLVGSLEDLLPRLAFLDAAGAPVASGLDPLAVFHTAAWHLRAADVPKPG